MKNRKPFAHVIQIEMTACNSMIHWCMMKFGCCALVIQFLLFSTQINSQVAHSLRFAPSLFGSSLCKGSVLDLKQNQGSIHISTLKFYVHDVHIFDAGKPIWHSGNEHFLVDLDRIESTSIRFSLFPEAHIDSISWVIGVDSTMQVNGAHSGVLDPMNGMYWSWQSGYIHWKFEAEIQQQADVMPIIWHIGGFRAPYNTLRKITLPVTKNSSTELIVLMDLSKLIAPESPI